MHFTIIPDLSPDRLTYRPFRDRIQLQPYVGTFAITLSSMVPHADRRVAKNFIDYVVSGIGLVVVAPLFAIIAIAIAIKISSPGPVFYKQERSGLNGRKKSSLDELPLRATDFLDSRRRGNDKEGVFFKGLGEMNFVGPRQPIPVGLS